MLNETHIYLFIIFILININIGAGGEANIVHPPYQSQHPCNHVRGHVKRNIILNKNITTSTARNISVTAATPKPLKTWQVGRVSRKQYEIINMLWRKTKIFGDVIESSIASTPLDVKYSAPNPSLQSSTASYIEFYYLDEFDDRIKRQDSTSSKTQFTKHFQDDRGFVNGFSNNMKLVLPSAPMFAFHVNNPNYKRIPAPSFPVKITSTERKSQVRRFPILPRKNSLKFINAVTKPNNKQTPIKSDNIVTKKEHSKEEVFINTETCPVTLTPSVESTETNTIYIAPSSSSTIYDKIKFFEMYDQDTERSSYARKSKNLKSRRFMDDTDDNQIINTDQKILLNHVDQIGYNHDEYHKMKYVKKHIIESFDRTLNETMNETTDKTSAEPSVSSTITTTNATASTPAIININASYANTSKTALWSDYSFTAVYIHEGAQVHCDAAGISPHWLVAAGSCLSRHQRSPTGQGRSAFVAYCGSQWWQPERVAYVKYTHVHPRFHHRDKIRRYLYNIGVIQVVSSMASACTGWAPISLMSHQFAAEQNGSIALAIGWGLDRFDTRYTATELPKWPLKLYKSLVFSDSCPGSIAYSKARRLDDGIGVNNIYCLSLPPYGGEEDDPVHGSVLLVGGKLIALYLQEERRSWGEQCAQYTGTWRLIPWVHKVAREPDDGDSFSLDL